MLVDVTAGRSSSEFSRTATDHRTSNISELPAGYSWTSSAPLTLDRAGPAVYSSFRRVPNRFSS